MLANRSVSFVVPFVVTFALMTPCLVAFPDAAAKAGPVCSSPQSDWQKSHLKAKGFTEVIFFASWCQSCVSHLQAATDKSLLVAVYDTRAAAEKALAHIFRKNSPPPPCVFDANHQLGKEFQVDSLPAKFPL